MLFKKRERKCAFCAKASFDHIRSSAYGYHCSDLDNCKERLSSTHIERCPVTKQEAFDYLARIKERCIFLSSMSHEFGRGFERDSWRTSTEIRGFILIGRSFHSLKETKMYEREFPDHAYNCQIPVNIGIRFDDDLFNKNVNNKIMGKAEFSGVYHENYGVTSNVPGEDPIKFLVDLYAPNEVEEKINSQVRAGLLVKNIYDAAICEHLNAYAFKDDYCLERKYARGAKYSFNTHFKCEFSSSGNGIKSASSKDNDVAGDFLNISNWVFGSKI